MAAKTIFGHTPKMLIVLINMKTVQPISFFLFFLPKDA